MRLFLPVISGLLLLSGLSFGQTNIADARQEPTGSTVTVSGIVTSGSELGTIRYMQDSTAGIAVYGSSLGSIVPGQNITVTGTLKDYYNLLEISPVTSVIINSSGNPLPEPMLLTPDQLSEGNESQLVRLNNVTFNAGQGNTFNSGTYTFTSAGEQGSVYIRSGHPLIGYSIPYGQIDLTGICSQYQSEYQLLLRSSADIIGGGIGIVVAPHAENITTDGLTIAWTTDSEATSEIYYGNTPVLELGKISIPDMTSDHKVDITGADPAELFYVQAFSVSGADTAFAPVKPFITQSLSAGWMKAYFTSDVDASYATGPAAISLGTAVEDTLIAYINRARYTIDMAIYNFTIDRVPYALNQAVQRGVIIRIVYNGNTSNTSLQWVPAIPKIASPDDSEHGIMHNKFVVFDAESPDPDEAIVWTGSTNLTGQQLSSDANNIIIINDQSLAKAYTLEFEEMWGSQGTNPVPATARFGPYKTNNTPHQFVIGGKQVESYFSPSDGVNNRIIEAFNSASMNADAAVFIITRTDIANAIQDRVDAGVEVNVIIDSESDLNSYPSVKNVLLGLGTHYTSDKYTTGLEHNKYVIIDRKDSSSDPLVLTGSHNWSTSADTRNDENTLVIHDAGIVNLYFQEFASRFMKNGGILSLKEVTWEKPELKCYPNPAVNHITIELNDQSSAINEVSLFSLTGNILKSDSYNGRQTSVNLNVDDLAAGIYLVKVHTSKGMNLVKLVKSE
ncbi:MAG TPA: phospholipase D-like domain-containing protein [Bacteroidales bacterium]|nr:phospholipase D-like domain-containing protein [Bacteroidales bacterium]